MKRLLFVLSVFTAISGSAFAQAASETVLSVNSSQNAEFTLVQMAVNLDHPWSIAFLPDGSILITERKGIMLLYKAPSIITVVGLPAIPASGQGGLMDVALHPDFQKNRLVYFSHTASIGSGTGTAVSRGYFTGTSLTGVERIFTSNKASYTTLQYGSRLAFGPDGKLYISLGDRGESYRAQDPYDDAGSIIRLNDDGTVPADNPFVSGGGAPEVFSYGHRNPQGLAVDPLTGKLWSHEHGPKGGDEVNKIRAGANYGWPVTTYGINYDGTIITDKTEAPGITGPLLYWVPSIAPSGMTFYTGNKFPSWKNDLFVGALAGKQIRRIIRKGEAIVGEEILLKDAVGRIRDIRTGPDGNLWFITDESNGGLYKIAPVK